MQGTEYRVQSTEYRVQIRTVSIIDQISEIHSDRQSTSETKRRNSLLADVYNGNVPSPYDFEKLKAISKMHEKLNEILPLVRNYGPVPVCIDSVPSVFLHYSPGMSIGPTVPTLKLGILSVLILDQNFN